MGNRYVDEFLRMACAPDVLAAWGRTPTKELTECMAVHDACRRWIPELFKSARVLFLDIGSGKVPRLGILMAHTAAWQCIAIDPRLTIQEYHTKRLTLYNKKLQEVITSSVLDNPQAYDAVVAGFNHAHVAVDGLWQHIKTLPLHVITIPCCEEINPKNISGMYYRDTSVTSPKNHVYYFKKILTTK